MAFTRNPQQNTYDSNRISFVGDLQQRNGIDLTKDYRLVNMMVELHDSPTKETKKAYIKSRPGMVSAYAVNVGIARGIYYWTVAGIGYVISVVAEKIYVNGVYLSSIITTTGQVGFTEFVSSLGAITLILVDGTDGYVFSSPAVAPTLIPHAGDFPSPHIPDPIFMDGYLFLAKAATQDIYNSNLDDPTLWTVGDFVSAEMYPDTIKALTKNNNYIYAVGSNSVEYFFDAANATGTPLQRHDAAVQQFGTVAGNTVVQTEKEVILIGATGNGGNTVWTIDGFKEKEIGTPAIKHALLAEGTNLQNATAYAIRVSGQKLYVLILTARTLVYSFDTKLWHEWASGVSGEFPFIGQFASDGLDGSAYILDKTGTNIYKMNASYFKDNLTNFRCEVTTSKFDIDTMNKKFISRAAIIGDIPDGGGTDNSFYLDWTDDDYNTWSTPRLLSYMNDFPMITQLGTFRRRAFRLRYSLPHLVRLEGLELDYNKGQQ